MLGNNLGYPPVMARPAKRPRSQPEHPVAADNDHLAPMAVDQPLPSTSHRLRAEERNSRKLSCKECRRLKLKCDRVFPCQSCVKRGCGSLCPEGALTSGRGSRFILANTEQLHEKIFELSERVRQLEDALGDTQSKVSPHPHPLLSDSLLQLKTFQELYGNTNPSASQYPSHHQPPASTSSSPDPPHPFREDTLRKTISSLTLNTQPPYSSPPLSTWREASPPDISEDILQLSATFPFPWAVDISIRKRIRDALPPKSEAMRICQEARNNALWQFNLDSSETFLPNLIHYCYATPIEALSPRRLALLLMHISIGCLVDDSRPLGSLHGEAYHHLARASVCEIPLMEEPDFDVIHALFFMIWYHLIFSDNKKAVGYAWNLMGFVTKLAQGLGLHRDSPRAKVIPEEDEKRRAIFWELLNMDCRMSLSLGRPPSIRLTHVDSKPPSYVGPGLYVPEEEIIYHKWKNAFFIQCLTPMLEAMVTIGQTKYPDIIRLDRSVRDFDVPSILDESKPNNVKARFLVMQRGLVVMAREIALLQLHRKYFTDAMNGRPEEFDMNHVYAPSVLATYLGASNLISAVETLFEQEPQLSVRFLHFWFNAFSAAVTLSLLISRAPSISWAPNALQDLERACRLFRSAGKILPFSGKALPVMQKLVEKSQRVLIASRSESSSRTRTQSPPASSSASTVAITDTDTDTPQSRPRSSPSQHLPTAFAEVHATLLQHAEKFAALEEENVGLAGTNGINKGNKQDSWLPDIYHFGTMGIGGEERYTFATAKPTPFTPVPSRVDENDEYNFDHGALSMELVEETSYMAWF